MGSYINKEKYIQRANIKTNCKQILFFLLCFTLSGFFHGNSMAQQVTGTRQLPENYTPDAELNAVVSIDVNETAVPNGLIVRETPPSGWEITQSDPGYNVCVEGTYKWIFYGGEVQDRNITYTVSVPSSALGEKIFSGELVYNDNGQTETDITQGDTIITNSTPPVLSVSTNILNFAAGDTAKQFTIDNTGTETLLWQAQVTQGWLSLTEYNGTLSTGQEREITATVDRTGLTSGTHTAHIQLSGNGGTAVISVAAVVDYVSAITSLFAYTSIGGIELYWTNPDAYTGTIIFRKIGNPISENPVDDNPYDIPGNPYGYPSNMGGGTCVLKDTGGITTWFDVGADNPLNTYYYKVYSFTGNNYSSGLQKNSSPSDVLATWNYQPATGMAEILANKFGFEILPDTFTQNASFNAGTIPAGQAPDHSLFKGFANIYGLKALQELTNPDTAVYVNVPVYVSDIESIFGSVEDITWQMEQLRVYHWPGNSWEELEIIEIVEETAGDYIGYIRAKLENFTGNDYFSLGIPKDTTVRSSGTGCFIATAAYGTPMTKNITTLCKFRDERLLTNSFGKAFVRFYYKHSPPMADFIRNKPALRGIIRTGLKPLVWIACHCEQTK